MKFSNGKCSPRSKISTLLIAREPPAVTASRSSETEVRSSKSSRLRSFQYITSIPSDQVFSECRVPATFWGAATLAATFQSLCTAPTSRPTTRLRGVNCAEAPIEHLNINFGPHCCSCSYCSSWLLLTLGWKSNCSTIFLLKMGLKPPQNPYCSSWWLIVQLLLLLTVEQ